MYMVGRMWLVGSERRLGDATTAFKMELWHDSLKHHIFVLSWLLAWWISCYSRYGIPSISYCLRVGVVVGDRASDRQDICYC